MASEIESEKRETSADIADEIRRAVESMGDDMPYTVSAGTMRRVADRIEVAWRREKAEAEAEALAVGGIVEAARHTPGNAAAMRDALVKIRDKCVIYNNDLAEEIDALCGNALSAPARNCDMFDDLKSAQRHYIEHGCPKGLGMLVDGEIRKFPWRSQFEKWLFAPAAEKGAGDGK